MKSIILTILLILGIYSISSAEDEISIATCVYTKHLSGSKGLNDHNESIFISYNKYSVGTFINSNYDRSWLLAYDLSTDKHDIINSDIFIRGHFYLGALYGYGDYMPNISGWTIGAAPTIEVGYKHISLESMITPAGGGVVSCLIKYTF